MQATGASKADDRREIAASWSEKGQRTPPRKQSHPFSQHGSKNNFPSLEHVWKSDSPRSIGSTPSELNMSIGARAALNEHLRYVAKYGIDGEGPAAETEFSSEGEEDLTPTKKKLEDQWEHLVKPSNADTSMSTGVGTTHSLSPNNTSNLQNISDTLTEVSNGFFSSSQVGLLETPEKNKAVEIRAVTTRGEETPPEDLSSSQSSQSKDSDMLEDNTGFLGVDLNLSGISAVGNTASPEEKASTPAASDSSRVAYVGSQRRIPFWDPTASPVKYNTDSSSFSSTPRRSPPISGAWLVGISPSPPTEPVSPKQSTNDRLQKQLATPRKKPAPDKSDSLRIAINGWAASPTLSPIVDRSVHSPIHVHQAAACLAATYKQSSLDTFSHDLAHTLGEVNFADTTKTPHAKRLKGSSERSSSRQSDRRRFRTVVPPRVFFRDSPPSGEYYPSGYDSFSFDDYNGSDAPELHTPKSLVASFDAALDQEG